MEGEGEIFSNFKRLVDFGVRLGFFFFFVAEINFFIKVRKIFYFM